MEILVCSNFSLHSFNMAWPCTKELHYSFLTPRKAFTTKACYIQTAKAVRFCDCSFSPELSCNHASLRWITTYLSLILLPDKGCSVVSNHVRTHSLSAKKPIDCSHRFNTFASLKEFCGKFHRLRSTEEMPFFLKRVYWWDSSLRTPASGREDLFPWPKPSLPMPSPASHIVKDCIVCEDGYHAAEQRYKKKPAPSCCLHKTHGDLSLNMHKHCLQCNHESLQVILLLSTPTLKCTLHPL